MAKVITVNGAQFDSRVLQGNRPAVVDFYATWCGPCQTLAPVVDEIAAQFDGQIDVFKVNIDEEPHLAEWFDILSIPTLVFFAGGEEVRRVAGALPRKQFTAVVRDVLSAPQSKV